MPTDDMGRYEIRVAECGGEVVGVACGDAGGLLARTWAEIPARSQLTLRPVDAARFRELQQMNPVRHNAG